MINDECRRPSPYELSSEVAGRSKGERKTVVNGAQLRHGNRGSGVYRKARQGWAIYGGEERKERGGDDHEQTYRVTATGGGVHQLKRRMGADHLQKEMQAD